MSCLVIKFIKKLCCLIFFFTSYNSHIEYDHIINHITALIIVFIRKYKLEVINLKKVAVSLYLKKIINLTPGILFVSRVVQTRISLMYLYLFEINKKNIILIYF
jgi:hypothetical protein